MHQSTLVSQPCCQLPAAVSVHLCATSQRSVQLGPAEAPAKAALEPVRQPLRKCGTAAAPDALQRRCGQLSPLPTCDGVSVRQGRSGDVWPSSMPPRRQAYSRTRSSRRLLPHSLLWLVAAAALGSETQAPVSSAAALRGTLRAVREQLKVVVFRQRTGMPAWWESAAWTGSQCLPSQAHARPVAAGPTSHRDDVGECVSCRQHR